MDLSLERESTVLGSLFQQIIADMKNTSPLWEDFLAKAGKLHATLRAAIQSISAYLDAFQKIADAATNSRGASKEIGTALTRVCLRHKAVETRLKTFTTAIMDCLVLPLQDKVEDWKRTVATIDKEHAKEYKRCRTELKKRSSDTLRLQKKARKGQSDTIQSLVDSHMQDVTLRRAELEDVEKKSLRAAMMEERMRYCTFVHMLQPVVKEECEVISELGHLQEAMISIANVTKDPNVLPQSSEELISDAKSAINLYPESPGGNSGSQGGCSNSLGSRKSSVCSISSMNSSGSSGSPGHHHYPRSLSQLISPAIRLKPGESSDSGFCSSPALTSQVSTSTNQSHAVSTWPPHSQDVAQTTDRPHTISSAYEKGHQRPALTVYTFQNPETIMESSASPKSPANIVSRPPLPVRCSSLERPLPSNARNNNSNLMTRQCPSPIPAHITKELPHHQQQQLQQPTYVNMSELATMAAVKITNQQQPPQPPIKPQKQNHQPPLQQQQSTDSQSSITSDSSLGTNRPKTPSLQSHPSTESGDGLTPTPSSGASTPHNITTPQLTNNSPSTPVTVNASSIGSGFTNNHPADILKITETDNTNLNSTIPSNDANCSTEREEIARGSVLQKTSMFEKQAAAASILTPVAQLSSGRSSHSISSGESIYSARKDDMLCKAAFDDKDSDQIYEDSIQELNNLIGELDSFQREHELRDTGRKINTALPNGSATDGDSDKISIGSFNYSTQSTNTSDAKFAYSDSELSRYVSETSSVGFENPTFAHLNQTGCDPLQIGCDPLQPSRDSDSGSIVMIYEHSLPITSDIDYLKQNSEIVVLRCKDPQTPEPTAVVADIEAPKQRLSSFRNEQLHDNITTPLKSEKVSTSRIARRPSVNSAKPPPPVRRSSSVTPSHNLSTPNSSNLVQLTATNNSVECLPPPPAYLLDRNLPNTPSSSLKVSDTVKALAAIRHTPASPSAIRRAQTLLNQQQQQSHQTPTIQSHSHSNNIYSSNPLVHEQTLQHVQSTQPPLPPPNPQKFPKTPTGNIPQTYSGDQSPSFRTTNSSSPGIYAQPKQPTNMSSFRTSSPSPMQQQPSLMQPQFTHHQTPPAQPKTNPNLIAQLNARLNKPSEYGTYQNVSAPNSPHHNQQQDELYARGNERYYQNQQQQFDDYSPGSIDKSGSMRTKSKAEFLENLNAKLAKQGLSGKAFAVRSLINSKALPDPRLCHESLMDQIKRGATLKRNRTINDRSAPKIH